MKLLLLLVLVGCALPSAAQTKKEPCCAVVAIDRKSGLVTLRNLQTGQASIVTVKDKAKLDALRVGQQVGERF
jgi:hypothetical protein